MTPTQMKDQMLCTFVWGSNNEQFMARYTIKYADILDGIVKFVIYTDLTVVDGFKIRILGWASHVVRMEDERIPPPKKKEIS